MLYNKYLKIILCTLIFYSIHQLTYSQSSAVKKYLLNRYPDPIKASLLSAILPGAGQLYTKKYWYVKLPIIYGGIGLFSYLIVTYNKIYIDSKNALLYLEDGDPNTNPIQINSDFVNPSASILENRMNFYRRERDFYIIISLVWYGLNIAEAATSAHLLNFDVSEDLSIYLEPYLNNNDRNLQGGLSLYLKANR